MKFSKLLLAITASSIFTFSACKKDDSSSSAPYSSSGSNGSSGNTSDKTNKEIITSKTWKFAQLLINNRDADFGSYKECETDNDWLFRGKELKIISRGIPCKNGESNGGVFDSGAWEMLTDESVEMKIKNETFEIISISNSNLRLRVNKGSENWDYVYRAK